MRYISAKNLVLALISLSFLSGCVTTAVVAGASALTATTLYDKRSFKTMGQDSNITTTLTEKIKANPMLQGNKIVIKSINHNVLLVGQVTRPEQRILIYKMAKNTPNVKRVYNQISVGNMASNITQAKDLWIEGRAQAALLEKKGLRSAQVRVIANSGVIYLMGILPNQQQALATDAVRQISGVKKVVTLFENVA